jgi:hypothetical protein
MPLLSRPAVRTHMSFCALSVLAIFCANPSAAEPITLTMLRPHQISPITPLTQVRCCPQNESAACRRNLQECQRINAPGCLEGYVECIEECHAGD